MTLEFGYFFCLVKDGAVVVDKKLKIPMYLCFRIISRAPGPAASFCAKVLPHGHPNVGLTVRALTLYPADTGISILRRTVWWRAFWIWS